MLDQAQQRLAGEDRTRLLHAPLPTDVVVSLSHRSAEGASLANLLKPAPRAFLLVNTRLDGRVSTFVSWKAAIFVTFVHDRLQRVRTASRVRITTPDSIKKSTANWRDLRTRQAFGRPSDAIPFSQSVKTGRFSPRCFGGDVADGRTV